MLTAVLSAAACGSTSTPTATPTNGNQPFTLHLGYLTNQESREGRAARYRLGPDALPEDKRALPETVPDQVSTSTPAQVAQVSPQVTDGCAPVRLCAGGAGDVDEKLCTICGELLDQALIDAGYTDHGEENGEEQATLHGSQATSSGQRRHRPGR